MTKLIILRGPSASGKSTVAKALMERTKRLTVLVDLDYYRFCFVNPDDPENGLGIEYRLSAASVLTSLQNGFDVIFDGNFTYDSDDTFLAQLLDHPGENYIFYLESSLEETLKRHETKMDPRINTDKMKEVYRYASPTGHNDEVVIPESSSLEQTVEKIRAVAGI